MVSFRCSLTARALFLPPQTPTSLSEVKELRIGEAVTVQLPRVTAQEATVSSGDVSDITYSLEGARCMPAPPAQRQVSIPNTFVTKILWAGWLPG